MGVRILLAGLLIAVAVGCGVWLHGYRVAGGCYMQTVSKLGPQDPNLPSWAQPRVQVKTRVCPDRVRPSWADPIALGGIVASFAVGAALTVPRFAKPS